MIFKKDFTALNRQQKAQGKPEFANPRNLAAGSIRQLDPRVAAARPLKFIAYDIVSDHIPTNFAVYEKLQQLKIQISGQQAVFSKFQNVITFLDNLQRSRLDLPFNTDGAVIKLNDRQLFKSLGIVGKTPRGAVAFKYPAEEATTIVRDIIISIGRTGAATPVAVLDPIRVAGSTVKAASLHNADEIARLDLRVGDTVIIFKAGDIIPQVQKVLIDLRPKNTQPFDYKAALRKQYPELQFYRPEGEVVYRIKGANSAEILKRQVQYYASKSALDIAGLGEKNVAALVDAKLISDIADLYSLTADKVARLDRFAKISADKLITAIQNSKHPALDRFITALGIRHVGAQTAIDLASYYKSFDQFAASSRDNLLSIDGIGEIVADSIIAYFVDADNLKILEKLKSLGVEPIFTASASARLAGLSFVVTGALDSMSREEAAERIRQLGGEFHTSVVKNTTYLVAGYNTGQAKLEKAAELGTKIIDETEFIKLLGIKIIS